VAKAPHHDLSGSEVEAGVRLSEHLLHLQRVQRRGLATAAARHAELSSLAAGLAGLADAPDALPPQVRDLLSCRTNPIILYNPINPIILYTAQILC